MFVQKLSAMLQGKERNGENRTEVDQGRDGAPPYEEAAVSEISDGRATFMNQSVFARLY
jgi:hypothetical protein